MILRLDPQDSSILARVAQYAQQDIPSELLHRLLGSASPEAREVGNVLLGEQSEAAVSHPDIAETANYFRQWAGKNRAYSKKRSSMAATTANIL